MPYRLNCITGELDLIADVAHGGGITEIDTDIGGPVTPVAGVVNLFGDVQASVGVPLQTSGAGDTATILVQAASAQGASAIANAGVASFDSAMFSVDADGYVSSSGIMALEFLTDNGSAVPSGDQIQILGDHWLNTSGATNVVTVAMDNAITLGDLSVIAAGSNAVTAQTGDVEIVTNNLKLPSTSSTTEGVVEVNGSSWLHSYGVSNIFLGFGIGNFTTTGIRNVFIGYTASSFLLTTGVENVGIGRDCLTNLTSGAKNVAVGSLASSVGSTHENCTAIGFSALINNGASNNTAIGSGASYNFSTGTNNVTVGVDAGRGSAGAASASNAVAVGYQAGFNFFSGDHNVAVGYQSAYSSSLGEQNTAVGSLSFFTNNHGSYNTAVGYQALFSSSSTTSNNTAIGRASLNNITSGGNNTALGYNSGFSITTGTDNICLGYQAGVSLTTNDSNNINIGNSGTAGDNDAIKIGTSGTHTTAYLQGVASVSVSNTEYVTIDTTTGQLGSSSNPNQFVTVTALDDTDSPYTALATDYYFSCDVSGGVLTINLPNAPSTGRVYVVKDSGGDAATNNITVTTVGGAVTIDGSTTFIMNTNYEAANFLFNGTSWEVF